MKAIFCIALLILVPFMAFAQEYTLTLLSSREPIKCDVLGAANGYLYYQTTTTPMIVVTVSSINTLYRGSTDLTYRLKSGEIVPFRPDALALFPILSDSLKSVNNANLIQQNQVEELRGIKNTLQAIAVFTLASAIGMFVASSKAKK